MPIDTRERILRSAGDVLDRNGFGTAVDVLVTAAGVSTRTLYQRVGGKDALVGAVLADRRRRFFDAVRHRPEQGLRALFDALEEWFSAEGTNGCLFLRAFAELGAGSETVRREVAKYDADLRAEVTERILHDLHDRDVVPSAKALRATVDEVLVVVEGVASMAVRLGPSAALIGRKIAERLVAGTGRSS